MKFVLAAHGTRGDIEPCAAVGLELMRRGHEVRMAAPPNLLGFVESVGLAPVAYGPDSAEQLDEDFFRKFWKIQNPISLIRAGQEYITRGWAEMSSTLTALADGANLVLTGMIYQELAANVAEYHRIPLASLHYFPIRPNGHLIPVLPSPLIRSAISTIWWLQWRMTKAVEDAQRRELRLPRATSPSPRRFTECGALEIQGYEEFCFPGLAAEWGNRTTLRRIADVGVVDGCGRRGRVVDRRWNTTDLLRIRQYARRISARKGCHDQRRLCPVRRACPDLLGRSRFHPHAADGGRKGCQHGESRGDLSRLPCSRSSWRRGHNSSRDARRSPYADPLDRGRTADLGSCGQTVESRLGAPLLEHDPKMAGR